ncbi:hypothetical protein OS493_023918 [Desmophyllum pertusum]|uniref:Uncharacterized protein n=1 Tax=Desmophyllum pertusum TaxID=174260 RepID=A0A9W9YAJ5_9CNID|nr:hypothetical protein OS493_023918 [Desmophyllum pertusum]
MDILRCLLFILALQLSVFYSHANVTSVKKKKSLNKPHGGHVANKGGWSTLHSRNTSHPNISPVVVSSENVPQQEAMIVPAYPVESIRDEKKENEGERRT